MGQTLNLVPNHDPSDRMLPQGLIGDALEVNVHIEDKDCLALQDTSSQVTTLSEGYYRTHLSHLPLYTCDGLVRVEGAGGDPIPYAGYIVASIHLSGCRPVDIPVLVVRDTSYNARVPVLIGTNVYNRLQVDSTQGELQENVKLALQTVKLAQKHLEESSGCYGVVYATQSTKLKPGTAKTVCTKTASPIPIPRTVALVTDVEDGRSEVTSGILQHHNRDKY